MSRTIRLESGARASRPQFSASRRKHSRGSRAHHLAPFSTRPKPVGGTPTGATGTVALPVPIESFRVGRLYAVRELDRPHPVREGFCLSPRLRPQPQERTPFGHAGTNHWMVRLSEALESFSLSPGGEGSGEGERLVRLNRYGSAVWNPTGEGSEPARARLLWPMSQSVLPASCRQFRERSAD